ncbi:MAG: glutathione S-transferase family protein, partial [Flavobacteriaceae bacterium]
LVEPLKMENGWEFSDTPPDPLAGARFLYERYLAAAPAYTGRVTVPVLWDRERGTIVSNESAEIIRMMNSAFPDLTGGTRDYYPQALRGEIDRINERVYTAINNGVYKAGFATAQAPYEEAVAALFEALDDIEETLSLSRFLAGREITEADWRLFTTLVRFDAVYHGHFKCNLRRIEDYPNLSNYLRQLYQAPGVAGTVDFAHIKTHYYGSHRTINPTGIVPAGPLLDYAHPHDRGDLAL